MAELEKMYKMLREISYRPFYDTRTVPFFVVLSNGSKVLVNFDCQLLDNGTSGQLAHVKEIRVCDEDMHAKILFVDINAPSEFTEEDAYPFEQYWKELCDIDTNFSQDQMDKLIQKGSSKMIFHAYQAVSQYVRDN